MKRHKKGGLKEHAKSFAKHRKGGKKHRKGGRKHGRK